jgi:hypothetical protein
MEKVNSKIAIQPRHLTFCLGICLDLLPHPSYLVQDVITKIQDIMAPSQRVMAQSTGVDQPINLAISFAQDEITQIQGHRWVHKALIALGLAFSQKRLQIRSLSRILIHGAFSFALCTT